MTDGLSVPDADTGPLPALAARVSALADRLRIPRAEVFDAARLSVASGVPEELVEPLLGGRTRGCVCLQDRFVQRLALLRRTRRKPDGRRYTQQEIADAAGMSRQQAGALINGDRRPTMEHCAAIQRFFGVHAGFLTADDPEALAMALQHTEQELLHRLDRQWRAVRCPAPPQDRERDPLEQLLRHHGVRDIALRAARLPSDQHRDKVTEWLDMLLEMLFEDAGGRYAPAGREPAQPEPAGHEAPGPPGPAQQGDAPGLPGGC
ncbi:transcriptional regulator [Streptomyces sulfonofaciens]|uniref:Transcriptional regulator n=1 Tax=Streptomyces sulfonofaciens TaxID=68272 RepID=A0A919GE12_9ACTN|nr:transcriptional regulator [Streptomyces sulfonofaciens]